MKNKLLISIICVCICGIILFCNNSINENISEESKNDTMYKEALLESSEQFTLETLIESDIELSEQFMLETSVEEEYSETSDIFMSQTEIELSTESFDLDNYEIENNSKSLDFVQVSGTALVDENGKEFRIKGICFGNNVWANLAEPTLKHHDESSYEEIASLGFNSVRFYMNYKLFEDDENPYKYKESGFEWLDKNIEWARKNNIKLILNMHVPQGGFISASKIYFWEKSENANRFVALWCEIARRYANEPVILGYGFMNEPYLPKMATEEDSLNLYYDLMEKLTSEIRKIDKKHVLFIERPYGIVDENKNVSYPWGDIGAFRCISDENVVYEFHFYEYTAFTSQGRSNFSFERDWYYADDSIALLSGKRDYSRGCIEKSVNNYDMNQQNWQYIESPIYDLSKYEGINAANFLLYLSELTRESIVFIDDVVIKEFDSNGNFIRNIYEYSFDFVTNYLCSDFGKGTGGECIYTNESGNWGLGCQVISGAQGDFKVYKSDSIYNNFPIKKGNKYQVSLYAKCIGKNQIIIKPGLQLIEAENVSSLNREFLEKKLLVYYNLGKEHNVPIYIGEFGTTSYIMGNEFRGEKWVDDMFDIINKYLMNYSYHDYHEEIYGLYTTHPKEERTTINKSLYNVFENKVKD